MREENEKNLLSIVKVGEKRVDLFQPRLESAHKSAKSAVPSVDLGQRPPHFLEDEVWAWPLLLCYAENKTTQMWKAQMKRIEVSRTGADFWIGFGLLGRALTHRAAVDFWVGR